MPTVDTDHSSNDLSIESRFSVVHGLRGLLNDGDEVDKCNASRALGTIRATEAIDDLVIKIRDEDIDVCIDAAEALGKLNATQVVPQLLESLKNDPDGELKTAIVKALGEIKSPQSIPALLEIAEHQPEGMIIDTNDDWDDWWDMQKEAVIALGNMKAEPATDVLLNLLSTDDVLDIENVILNALVNISVKGERVVIDKLKTGLALTRRRAATALSFSSSAESLKALSASFTDSSDDVRISAIQALVDRKAVKYLPAIELLKKDRSDKVRKAAIVAFNTLSKEISTDTTTTQGNDRLLNDPDAEVRSTYLESLQSEDVVLTDEQLLEQITTALNDSNEQVILSALPLLVKLNDAELAETQLLQLISRPKLSDLLIRTSISTLAKLSRWNVNISRTITRLINHDDQSIRLITMEALMNMEKGINYDELDQTQSKTPIDIINETLNGRVVLEIEVSSLLESKAPEETAEEEIEVADEATDNEPTASLSTLDSIMQDSLVAEQQPVVNDSAEPISEEDPDIDEYHSLVQDNITKAEWLFNSKEKISVAQDVQRQAARILAKLPTQLNKDKSSKIVSSLTTALNSEDLTLSTNAAESLAQIANDNPQQAGIEYAYGALMTQFHNEQWDLKIACIKALAAIRNRAAIPVLMTALDHKRTAIRIQAITSITDLELNGHEFLKNEHVPEEPPTLTEWVNLLIESLKDKEPGIRYSAVNNLKRCLLTDEISQQQDLIDKAIEQVVQSAFDNHGGRTRDMAQVLKEIEPVQGTERLVQLLTDLPTSYERRFAIEMLEEMYRYEPETAMG